MQLVRPQHEGPVQNIDPPKSNQVGLVANAGTTDTASSVMSTVIQVGPQPGSAALAGSSSDSAATYRRAHAAAASAAVDPGPPNRISMHYEAQIARAIRESYYTWFEDKRNRERTCAELSGASSTTPALTDIAPAAVSKSKGSHK